METKSPENPAFDKAWFQTRLRFLNNQNLDTLLQHVLEEVENRMTAGDVVVIHLNGKQIPPITS